MRSEQPRRGVGQRSGEVSISGGERALRDAVDVYAEGLQGRLLGAYALGSLAHGGFSDLVSDIDLGLVLADPPQRSDTATVSQIAVDARTAGRPLDARLSVFWGTPATLRGEVAGGRFPPLDRLDLIENGRLMTGTDEARQSIPRPEKSELVLAAAAFALERLAGVELWDPWSLVDAGVRPITKTVLYPVRFLYTAETGRVGANDVSVEHYLNTPAAPSKTLVSAAYRWRAQPAASDAEVAALLRCELVSLYEHYIELERLRLLEMEKTDLAEAFAAWSKRLSGARCL